LTQLKSLSGEGKAMPKGLQKPWHEHEHDLNFRKYRQNKKLQY
jgi:hypothetical protein